MSFTLKQGGCLAIVGESGSGKTTLGKLIIGMEKPDSGTIHFDHINLATTSKRRRSYYKKYSNRFQDCHSAVNPKMKIQDIIAEPMNCHLQLTKQQRLEKIKELLVQVGLSERDAQKYLIN